MLQTTKVIHEDVTSPVANEKYGQIDLTAAIDNFWHYRCVINPRLTLKGMWFPRTLATKLRTFWEDFKAGRRPVMLLMTPPQHGKSLSVIDFIAWAIGHDPELRVIYSSFSDRLGVRANLRLQRALDSKTYRFLFPGTRLNDKHIVTIAERSLRNHEVLEFVVSSGAVRPIASAHAVGTLASGQRRNAVPTCTAEAPSSSAAPTPRPSAIPPAATTGTFTASTTAGNRLNRPTILASAFVASKAPRCPPASMP